MPLPGKNCPGNVAGDDCVDFTFWGRQDKEEVRGAKWSPDDLSVPTGFVDYIERIDHTTTIPQDKIAAHDKTIGEWLQAAILMIQTTRSKQNCLTKDHGQGCMPVRSTPNNPESSRGHLFTM